MSNQPGLAGRVKGSIAAALVILSGCASQSARVASEPPRTTPAAVGLDASRLDAEAEAMLADIKAGVLPGAVMVVGRNGQVAWERSLGTQGPNDPAPMSLDTLFRIQSMTKPIVSVAVMTLVEQGRIGLDDPVSKYLPEYAQTTVYDGGTVRPARGVITVRHLLTHTSGLIAVVGPPRSPLHEIWQKSGAWTQDQTVLAASRATGALPMLNDPGTRWNYGRSVDVLGAILEVATGKTFDVVLKEQIFNPLGMNSTDFYLTPQQAAGRVAQANGGRAYDPTQRRAMMFGTNGLASTTRDYLRFTMMLAGGGALDGVRILKPETLRLMTTDQLGPQVDRATFPYKDEGGFGLGFGLKPEGTGGPHATKVWTWGGSDGTNFWVDPKSGVFVVYMIQNAAQGPRLQARFNKAVFDSLGTNIEDAAWLAGRWTGTGLGGQLEEVWSAPAGGQMVGHFRLVQDGKPVFYEFILLDVVESGVRMRLKHFNPDHTAWEEKDAWTTFSPVSASPTKLEFSALTIERTGTDSLTMTLKMRRDGKVVDEILKFQRAAP